MTETNEPRYSAEQLDGETGDLDLDNMWSVIDNHDGGKVVASWRETPITGLSEREAVETAQAWNRLS